jgi:hypothetical protein
MNYNGGNGLVPHETLANSIEAIFSELGAILSAMLGETYIHGWKLSQDGSEEKDTRGSEK